VLDDHPDGALTHFWGVSGVPWHCSILSREGASRIPGPIHVFAVTGLGVALGSIAFAVASVAWVQTTSFLTLDDLCEFPTEKKWFQLPGSRIKFRVRESIERDMARRGTGALPGTHVSSAAAAWKAARDLERERREALVKLNDALQLLTSPNRQALEEARTSSKLRGNDPWADGDMLISLATKLADSRPEPGAASDGHSNLDELQDEAIRAYTSSKNETNNRFELVQRILYDASYLRLKYSFSMVLKYVVLVLALAGAGISTFAWATHPPKSDEGTPGVLVVSRAQASSRGLRFTDCDASTLKIDSLSQPNELIISAASSTSGKACVITLSP
jgi:hypothetical protein